MNNTLKLLIIGISFIFGVLGICLAGFTILQLYYGAITTDIAYEYMTKAITFIITAGVLPVIGTLIDMLYPDPIRTERLQWE